MDDNYCLPLDRAMSFYIIIIKQRIFSYWPDIPVIKNTILKSGKTNQNMAQSIVLSNLYITCSYFSRSKSKAEQSLDVFVNKGFEDEKSSNDNLNGSKPINGHVSDHTTKM